MALQRLDVAEANFANAIFKIAGKSLAMQRGDILEIIGFYRSDMSRLSFKKGIKSWCERSKKELLFIEEHDKDQMRCHVRI